MIQPNSSNKSRLYHVITTHHEKNIISEFSKEEDLVLANACKRGATVTLDTEDYIKKVNQELKDENYTKKSGMIQHRNM